MYLYYYKLKLFLEYYYLKVNNQSLILEKFLSIKNIKIILYKNFCILFYQSIIL